MKYLVLATAMTMKLHDIQNELDKNELRHLENLIFSDILEYLVFDIQNEVTQNGNECKCKKCKSKEETEQNFSDHTQTTHKSQENENIIIKCEVIGT